MNENKEQGYEDTESLYELFKAAQRDILTIKSIIKKDKGAYHINLLIFSAFSAPLREEFLQL